MARWKRSIASSLLSRVSCDHAPRPRRTYSYAARLLVGFARARSRSKRVSSTAAAPTTLLAMVSCTAKISSISALYVSDQTSRPVVASINWTPTRTRLPRVECCRRADSAHSEGDRFLQGRLFEFLNGKLEDFEMTSRFEKRPSAAMTSSVIPSLKKSWAASPDRFLNGSTATEGRASSRAAEARVATSTGLATEPSSNRCRPTSA